MSATTTTFGQRLREARLQRGLSQEKLARELDVTTSTVRSWETGRHGPRWDQLERVCILLGWDLPGTSSDSDTPGYPNDVPLSADVSREKAA